MAYEPLEWDSDFFGIRIGRLSLGDEGSMESAVEEADADGVSCLYLLCPVEDVPQMHAALSLGFRPYDVRVELSCSPEAGRAQLNGVRDAREDDEGALLDLARKRMRGTRFWADPRFPRERVEALYGEWLRRGLTTLPRRRTLVAGAAEGFVTCHFDQERGVGTIELIAVAADREGRRLGDELVTAAEEAFAASGLARAEVVTQAQNIAAQRLYQRNGYRTSKVGIWLHRWRSA